MFWLLVLIILLILCTQARYFVDEVKNKSGKDIDVSSWAQEFVEDLPEQENGFVPFKLIFRSCNFLFSRLFTCFSRFCTFVSCNSFN